MRPEAEIISQVLDDMEILEEAVQISKSGKLNVVPSSSNRKRTGTASSQQSNRAIGIHSLVLTNLLQTISQDESSRSTMNNLALRALLLNGVAARACKVVLDVMPYMSSYHHNKLPHPPVVRPISRETVSPTLSRLMTAWLSLIILFSIICRSLPL